MRSSLIFTYLSAVVLAFLTGCNDRQLPDRKFSSPYYSPPPSPTPSDQSGQLDSEYLERRSGRNTPSINNPSGHSASDLNTPHINPASSITPRNSSSQDGTNPPARSTTTAPSNYSPGNRSRMSPSESTSIIGAIGNGKSNNSSLNNHLQPNPSPQPNGSAEPRSSAEPISSAEPRSSAEPHGGAQPNNSLPSHSSNSSSNSNGSQDMRDSTQTPSTNNQLNKSSSDTPQDNRAPTNSSTPALPSQKSVPFSGSK